MNLFTSLFRRAERRRSYSSMLQLDDHLLADIGVTRTDLFQMMNGTRTAHTKDRRRND